MKKAVVINDLSGFGKCSLTAAIPVLSVLGIQCVPLPTAVLTGQTGYKYYHCTDLTDMMPLYIDAWKKNDAHFDAIYSGYMTGSAQIEHTLDFVDAFYKEDTFLLVDPVMGDDGHVYSMYTDDHLAAMKKLSRKADLITPNLTEACLLADVDVHKTLSCQESDTLLHAAQEIGMRLFSLAEKPQDIVITGIKCPHPDHPYIYNIAISGGTPYITRSHFFNRSFSGTGDLFASAMCGLRLCGIPTCNAMEQTQAFLQKGIEATMQDHIPANDGIHFEKYLGTLMKGVSQL